MTNRDDIYYEGMDFRDIQRQFEEGGVENIVASTDKLDGHTHLH